MSDSRLASSLALLWHQIKSEEQGHFIKALGLFIECAVPGHALQWHNLACHLFQVCL